MKVHRILGVDYSTANVGISLLESHGNSLNFIILQTIHLSHIKSHRDKRRLIYSVISELPTVDMIVLERIRLFKNSFISLPAIIALSGMIATIMDATNFPVYSIDTRNWKSRILGNPSGTKDDAVSYVNYRIGLSLSSKDHDLADAICISIAGFASLSNPKIVLKILG